MFDFWSGTGHVGKVGELKTSDKGVAYMRFSVGINKGRKGDEEKPRTKWVECTVFNGLAETCAAYLTPGKLVQVVGDVTARWYPGKQQIFAVLDCVAEKVRFLSGGQATEEVSESSETETGDEPKPLTQAEATSDAAIPNFTETPKTGKRARKAAEAFTAF